MKAIEQYFHVVLFVILYKVVLTFKSVDKTLVCDHSNESYRAVLPCRTVYCPVHGGSTFVVPLVQSLNSPFFPPHIGTEPGRAKEESRITCMRMLRTPPFFPPKSRETPYLEVFSRFSLWRNFLNDKTQATISAFRLIKTMSINPKSVEFHQFHTKPHSTYHNIKDNEINICQDLLTIENTDFGLESARAALCKWATCTRQTFLSKTFAKSHKIQKQYKMFGKKVMTCTRCR